MTKVFCRVSMFRFGVKRFEEDINSYLTDGWEIEYFSVEKTGLLRFLCLAILKKKCCD